jgi:uncharacterized protein
VTVYVDTSALYAVLVADDPDHHGAADVLRGLHDRAEHLVATSYVLVETEALLQARVGLPAVRTLHEQLCPILEVVSVDAPLHDAAMTALLAAGQRRLSLVDWVGITLMRQRRLEVAFAFDDDFAAQGFTVLP